MGGWGGQLWGPGADTAGARMRYRRDAGEEPEEEEKETVLEKIEDAPHKIEEEMIELEHEAEEKLKPIAEMAHMKPW